MAGLIFPGAICPTGFCPPRGGVEGSSRWGAKFRTPGEEVIDLAGNFLAPGFIDLHVHGAVGRDTMEGTADAFVRFAIITPRGGTTSLLLTTVTAPLEGIARGLGR